MAKRHRPNGGESPCSFVVQAMEGQLSLLHSIGYLFLSEQRCGESPPPPTLFGFLLAHFLLCKSAMRSVFGSFRIHAEDAMLFFPVAAGTLLGNAFCEKLHYREDFHRSRSSVFECLCDVSALTANFLL